MFLRTVEAIMTLAILTTMSPYGHDIAFYMYREMVNSKTTPVDFAGRAQPGSHVGKEISGDMRISLREVIQAASPKSWE